MEDVRTCGLRTPLISIRIGVDGKLGLMTICESACCRIVEKLIAKATVCVKGNHVARCVDMLIGDNFD